MFGICFLFCFYFEDFPTASGSFFNWPISDFLGIKTEYTPTDAFQLVNIFYYLAYDWSVNRLMKDYMTMKESKIQSTYTFN